MINRMINRESPRGSRNTKLKPNVAGDAKTPRNIIGLILIPLLFGGSLAWGAEEGNRAAAAPVTSLNLSLADLTQAALKNSPKLESARLSALSAQSEAHSAGAAEFPRISAMGNYFYQTTIPDLQVSPMAPAIPFGFHDNWSAYANLSFDLWDFRSLHNQANSLDTLAQSQDQAYAAAKRQLLLAVRMAYFQAQINLEQVRLLGDSLKVAQAQYADISHQAKYGTASKLDLLSSHQEVLSYQRSFSQAQAALAGSLRDLFDLVGVKEPGDFSAPLDARMEGKLPEGTDAPTVWISMDPKDTSLVALLGEAQEAPDDSVPQLKTYAFLAESARFAADSVASQMLPKVTLSGQAGWQNPIGPINETIQQNIVSVTASMPLFDWGQILDDSDSKRKQSQAYLKNLDQAQTDLWRDWNKAQDQLRTIKYQQGLNQTAVAETQELSRLTYASYRAGQSKFLEVQTANFQALTAAVQDVANDIQMLMQLSVLSSLAGAKE
jgi:multidrug efflux system outer membrane protein